MELVDLQRLVAFILRPAVGELGVRQVLNADVTGDLTKAFFVVRGEVVENNVVVLQPFGFLDGEDERGLKMGFGRLLLIRVHDHYRKAG